MPNLLSWDTQFEPRACALLTKLADGVLTEQSITGVVAVGFQRINQVLLMVAAQPGGTSKPHLSPHQIHRSFDPVTSIDHISTEDQMIGSGQHSQQGHQGSVAAVNIPDDPVALTQGWQGINLGVFRL